MLADAWGIAERMAAGGNRRRRHRAGDGRAGRCGWRTRCYCRRGCRSRRDNNGYRVDLLGDFPPQQQGERLFGLFGNTSTTQVTVRLPLAVLIGAALGLVSGMIGIGGGILLSPAILLLRWADVKETAAVSALFIFVNSAAGILGAFGSGATIGVDAWGWIAAVIFGGLIGGHIGSNLLKEPRLRQVLGAVLLLASVKLMLP